MPVEVLQRHAWHGEPRELGDLFHVENKRQQGRAALFTHQFGWEVRLLLGRQAEPVRTQVCRSQDEVLTTIEAWKAAMLAEGWAERGVP